MEPKLIQLSVIIPTTSAHSGVFTPLIHAPKTKTERAVANILEQADPVGTEIIVVDDSTEFRVADHIEAIFANQKVQGKLQVKRIERCGDSAKLKNAGAEAAQGKYLAFTEYLDWWKPGRLSALEPRLHGVDLMVGLRAEEARTPPHDWLAAFLGKEIGIRGSTIVSRTLFDRVGGFSEGYAGAPLPRRIPGSDEYEFWIKCLCEISKTKGRFEPEVGTWIQFDEDPPEMRRLLSASRSVKKSVSLIRSLRRMPLEYWPIALRGAIGKSR